MVTAQSPFEHMISLQGLSFQIIRPQSRFPLSSLYIKTSMVVGYINFHVYMKPLKRTDELLMVTQLNWPHPRNYHGTSRATCTCFLVAVGRVVIEFSCQLYSS